MDRRIRLASSILLIIWSLTSIAAQSRSSIRGQRSGAKDGRMAIGTLIAEGHNRQPVGRLKLLSYRLEEVELAQPVELQIGGIKQQVDTALRLTVTSDAVQTSRVIWVGDVLFPEVWEVGVKSVATLIYDRSLVRDGAVISVGTTGEWHDLPERLKLPESFKADQEPEKVEDGNEIIGIRSALRIAGSERHSLVKIEIRTARPLPVINGSYVVQIGRRFFGRLGGHGTNWTLELTPKEFDEVKEGDRVAIGVGVFNIAYLGRLNKSLINR
ncbi:MAG TPA: hypothetical protein VJ023_09180 [Pyrinomonadaceae bacterium]|nr:hypothetical protein [Pyrinomonadaceae bacterium]